MREQISTYILIVYSQENNSAYDHLEVRYISLKNMQMNPKCPLATDKMSTSELDFGSSNNTVHI